MHYRDTLIWLHIFLIIIWTVNCSLTRDSSDTQECLHKSHSSSEVFTMMLKLCRKNVSITCEIGGNSQCSKDRESFKATAIVDKHTTKCLLEANTTQLKYIKFVIKAKYLKNLNELGSRSLGEEEEPEVQRGKCTLGYTCIDNQYLHDIRVNCLAFHYDKHERSFNGSSKKFIWTAPKNYVGSVIFTSLVRISYSSFFVDVETAKINLPD